MTYAVTAAQLASITGPEIAFGTERLLPAWEVIPEDFKKGNFYTKLAEAIFYGTTLPQGEMDLNEGIDPEMLNRAVRAHITSFGPKHEHKIAGVGYMIASACTITPAPAGAP